MSSSIRITTSSVRHDNYREDYSDYRSIIALNDYDRICIALEDPEFIKKTDHNGNTVLHLICSNEEINPDIILEVLKRDKSLANAQNKFGCTPLFFVTDKKIFEIFADNGADFRIQDNKGDHVLHTAMLSLDLEAIQVILQENKELLFISNGFGALPLHSICDLLPNEKAKDILNYVIQVAPEILHCKDCSGSTLFDKLKNNIFFRGVGL